MRSGTKLSGLPVRVYWAAFAALIALCILYGYVVFRKASATLAAMPFACLAAIALLLWNRFLEGAPAKAVARVFPFAAIGMAALLFAVNMGFCRLYRYTPVWDASAVFQGAINWARGDLTAMNSPTFDAQTYFLYFPNNLGATALLSLWFRLTGTTDAYMSACMLNAILLCAMALAVAFTSRELGGPRAGLNAIALMACTCPLWCCAAAFYTDFLSIAFPVGGFCLLLLSERFEKPLPRAGLTLLAAATFAVGGLAKATVWIMAISVLLWLLFCGRLRSVLLFAVCCALTAVAANGCLRAAVYPGQLDPEQASLYNTPTQHWIMMGLSGDGYYNGYDYAYTRSFDDPAERTAALNAEIIARIRGRGFADMLDHCLRKTGFMLSDGTLMLSDLYDDWPIAPEWCTDTLLPGGSRYMIWQAASNGVRLASLLLALAGAIRAFLRRERGPVAALYLAVGGLMLFLAFWETSRRYSVNFLPVLILCAVSGLPRNGIGTRRDMV